MAGSVHECEPLHHNVVSRYGKAPNRIRSVAEVVDRPISRSLHAYNERLRSSVHTLHQDATVRDAHSVGVTIGFFGNVPAAFGIAALCNIDRAALPAGVHSLLNGFECLRPGTSVMPSVVVQFRIHVNSACDPYMGEQHRRNHNPPKWESQPWIYRQSNLPLFKLNMQISVNCASCHGSRPFLTWEISHAESASAQSTRIRITCIISQSISCRRLFASFAIHRLFSRFWIVFSRNRQTE